MESILSTVQLVFTAVIGWFKDVAGMVVEQPILVLFLVAIPLIWLVYGLVMRIVGRGRGRRG